MERPQLSSFRFRVNLASAHQEPAWCARVEKSGLENSRIEKFEIHLIACRVRTLVLSTMAILVLKIHEEEDEEGLKDDVCFWIGQYSTKDEYGLVAYKVGELDSFFERPAFSTRVSCRERV